MPGRMKKSIIMVFCIWLAVFEMNPGVVERAYAAASLKVQIFNSYTESPIGTLYPNLRIYNTGTDSISLPMVTLRYYYTIDDEYPQNFFCDFSSIGAANIAGNYVKLPTPVSGADYYLEIGFKSGAGNLAPGAYVDVHTRIAKADWSDYTQTNDYSFHSSAIEFTDWQYVPAYISGTLVWGNDPAPLSMPGATTTPTPTPTQIPSGYTNLISGKIAASSIALSNAASITDGNLDTWNYVGMDSGAQWIQYDFGQSYNVDKIKIWHYYGDGRTYRDVIVQLSNNAAFSSGVITVFNNDTNNSAGQGAGSHAEYVETSSGKEIAFSPVNARYVRLWTHGSTANIWNHYVEVEVYGSTSLSTSMPTPTPTPTPSATPTTTPTSSPSPSGYGNLVLGKMPTSSTAIDNIIFITNGTREYWDDARVGTGVQWIQFDFGQSYHVDKIRVWHNYEDGRKYHDVIWQLSNSATFGSGVTTVFNNDTNNSAGQGIGSQAEYAETAGGKEITFGAVNARYIRLWSNGSTTIAANQYVEVEVYGSLSPLAPTPTPTAVPLLGDLFYSGFELGDIEPLWGDTIEGSTHVSGYLSGINPEASIRQEVTYKGSRSLVYSGFDENSAASYCYYKVFDVNIPVSIGTNLSYWIWPQNENGRYAAVDFILTDGSRLRDSAALDTTGKSLHPSTARGTVNTWTQITSNVGQWLNGKTIDRILVAYDQPASTGQYRGYLDEIRIYNGVGVTPTPTQTPVNTPTPTGLIFSDDFNDGDLQGWITSSGLWTNGGSFASGVKSLDNAFLMRSEIGCNFGYEAELTMGSGSEGALIFRCSSDASSGYRLNISPDYGNICIYSLPSYTILGSYNTPISSGVKYPIKLTAVGQNIKVYFNHGSTPVIDIVDSTYTGGLFGFNAYNGTVQFDNVSAYVLTPPSGPGNITSINDNDPAVWYSGAWSYSSVRPYGDIHGDVHYTAGDNDFVQYSFYGTGIAYITEKNNNLGEVDIYIDGSLAKTVNCYSPVRVVKQAVYTNQSLSPGLHTVKAVKKNGQYMVLDAFRFYSGTIENCKSEGEYSLLSGSAAINNNQSGYGGTGFVNSFNTVGAGAEFKVNNGKTGLYHTVLRYSNGSGSGKTASLYVNGSRVKQISLADTGNWNTWAEHEEPVSLAAGNNKITYKIDSGDTGGILLDRLVITTGDPKVYSSPVPGNGSGLKADYFDQTDFTGYKLTRTDGSVDFNWGTGSPHTLLQADTFSVRWTGQIEPKFTESYTFFTQTDDGVRLWVNNQLIIDQWNSLSASEWSGTISLAAGQKYNIKMEYFENTQSASAKLLWMSPGQLKEIIPGTQLSPSSPVRCNFHTVRTPDGNSFVLGDAIPLKMGFQVLMPVENPVISINTDIKKSDGSSSGFLLKEINKNGSVDKSSISIYKNNMLLNPAQFTLAIDPSGGGRKLRIRILTNFSVSDLLEVRYTVRASAKDHVIDTGVGKYLESNGLTGADLKVLLEISEWMYQGTIITTPYTKDRAEDPGEKNAFFADIRIEDSSIID
ncbi:MAG: PA14 domain-containing protein [Clostridia bacterium]|nr:PA14 domain-containing protein [Clostridia bacterium]